MSYAVAQTPVAAHPGAIRVGPKAGHDVILAQASYDASKMLLESTKRPAAMRSVCLRDALRRYGPGSWERFESERRRLVQRGSNANQAVYDALRLVAANYYAAKGVEAIKSVLAQEYGSDVGLGLSNDERSVACGITGGLTLIGGLIGSIYGGQAGGGAAGAAGSTAAAAFDCSKEQRESQERVAAAQAQSAQAMADSALRQAQAQERAAQERTKQVQTLALVGGGLVLLFGVGYVIVSS